MYNLVLDIWHGNRGIDLAEWKARHALWAVIPKCGGSDDKRVGRYEESTFHDQCRQARELGLHVGAFYYSDALTAHDALIDAEHCIHNCLAGESLDMPVYIDIEELSQLELSLDQLTSVVSAFCQRVEQAGYKAGIYSGYDGFSRMDDAVTRWSLWAAAWGGHWPKWARSYDLWQQGGMRLSDGDIIYADVQGYVDCDWPSDEFVARIEGRDMTLREQIANLAKQQVGIPYYSMNYHWKDGWGGMGTHYVGKGCGCAQLVSMLFNTLLGTNYVGSCWNFAGDCLGDPHTNQGGGEFEWVDPEDTEVGDIVLYCKPGYTGTDAEDYGHTAVLIGNGRVVGAMGQGKPGQGGYLNIGVRNTLITDQTLGGKIRYARCKRIDERPKPTMYSTKLWASNNTEMQHFNIHRDGDVVRWFGTGRRMWLNAKAEEKGSPVRLDDSGRDGATKWKLIPVDVPYMRAYKIALHSQPGLVLDCKDGGTTKGTGLRVWKDNGTPAQKWLLCDSGDGLFRLISTKSGLAIDFGPEVQ